MLSVTSFIFLIAIFFGGFFLADAFFGFIQVARGRDEDTLRRRLLSEGTGDLAARVQVVRKNDENAWYNNLPFQKTLVQLAKRAGPEVTLRYVWLQILVYSVFLLFVMVFLLPPLLLILSFLFAPVLAFFLVALNLHMKAKKRREKFEEQLPDALDLMIRSLRVGHPVNGAMAVIAREMPAPIGPEFAIACEEVTYGHDIPTAFRAMAERVPIQDLKFLNVVLQVQQDSGGNLVESLAGLSAVIRERFRMFRKVKSLTVEGRVSAWILSLFPLGLIVIMRLIKPDYFDQVMQLELFPLIVAVIVVLLIVNIIAMRLITRIEV